MTGQMTPPTPQMDREVARKAFDEHVQTMIETVGPAISEELLRESLTAARLRIAPALSPPDLPRPGAGWRVVPVDPPDEMLLAVESVVSLSLISAYTVRRMYVAMLAAAPEPAQVEAGREELALILWLAYMKNVTVQGHEPDPTDWPKVGPAARQLFFDMADAILSALPAQPPRSGRDKHAPPDSAATTGCPGHLVLSGGAVQEPSHEEFCDGSCVEPTAAETLHALERVLWQALAPYPFCRHPQRCIHGRCEAEWCCND